ncbi:hypothetical protein P7K49_032570 [Saguinus oedipus]|uniref:Uncharacterized protein n=1 Tax=Saguinus oedipus TaxID=9490 RepID=A0ABQ9TZF8_SAGOE|nr:hypothetical protein P7K49_032570 [Saguinus oedipus]
MPGVPGPGRRWDSGEVEAEGAGTGPAAAPRSPRQAQAKLSGRARAAVTAEGPESRQEGTLRIVCRDGDVGVPGEFTSSGDQPPREEPAPFALFVG